MVMPATAHGVWDKRWGKKVRRAPPPGGGSVFEGANTGCLGQTRLSELRFQLTLPGGPVPSLAV